MSRYSNKRTNDFIFMGRVKNFNFPLKLSSSHGRESLPNLNHRNSYSALRSMNASFINPNKSVYDI